MRHALMAALVAPAIVVGHGAGAAGGPYSSAYLTCVDPSRAVPDTEVRLCIEEELTRQDDRLNAEHQRQLANSSPTRRSRLREAHRAWTTFRDANCAVWVDRTGAEMRLQQRRCVLEETVRHAEELADIIPE